MTNYKLVTTPEQFSEVRQQLIGRRAIGVDTETTHLDPFMAQVRLLQLASPEMVYIVDLFQIPKTALTPMKELLEAERPVKVLHHAKFDAKMLRHHFGIELTAVFDTMLASQLVSAGDLTQRQGLTELTGRYLGRRIEKTLRTSDWAGALSQAMLEYAAEDAAVLLPLRQRLIEKIKDLQLVNVAKLEFDCILPTAAMELAGIYVDRTGWETLVKGFEAKGRQLEAEVKQDLAAASQQVDLFGEADINLNSPQQVQEAFARLGIPIHSTRELELESYAEQFPVIAKLIEYRHVQKFLSTYGRILLDHIHPATGRIHADFRQIGTPTGRFSCSNPNVQQVPNIPEVRACFTAPAGTKLVVADYSQIELCILAEFSRDPRMMDAFLNGTDLHRSTASLMFQVPVEEVTKEQRHVAKSLNYGLLYGMGAAGLAARIGASVTEAERLMARYFDVYRRVADWLRAAADTAASVGHSRTHWGRLWNFRFDQNDREQVATVQRLGKNAPIQGCLTGDALVYTDRGLIKIEDLAQGVRHASSVFDGQEWRSFRPLYSGRQRVAQLALENGIRLCATHDHPVLAWRQGVLQWVELATLQPGEAVALCSRRIAGGQLDAPQFQHQPPHWRATWKQIPAPAPSMAELAALLGRLVGGGWYGNSVRNGEFLRDAGQTIQQKNGCVSLTSNQTPPIRRARLGSASVEACRHDAKMLGHDAKVLGVVDPRLDFDYAKVARVEDTGAVADTYDLIVNAQEHRFVANGIIVHNTSADILKRAMRLVYDALRGGDAQIINSIHDEIVVESDQAIAEEVAQMVRERMIAAAQEFIRAIPVEVDVHVGETWIK
jgi:DNA polymerase I-like protein with 3'-5' exonuclease and polymerase domains